MTPLVSVIIPAYNHEDFVAAAITSVLGQSFKDFELLIIDDGSTDATLERINGFSDSRIRVMTQANQGAAAALNRGLAAAGGRYIAILNSDDCYHPERLQRLYETLDESADVLLATTGIRVVDRDGEPVVADWLERGLGYYKKSGNLFFALIRDNFICSTSNLFFRRELLEKTGYFLELRYCHDLDFILQAALFSEVSFLDEVLLDYRVHDTNTIRESRIGENAPFKFEVASVIAYALSRSGRSLQKAPFFMDELLQTQFGALLDSIALLLGFFNGTQFERGQFADLLKDADHPLKLELLKFIQARNDQEKRPWKLYHEILEKYEVNVATVTALHQSLLTKEKQLIEVTDKVIELNQSLLAKEKQLIEVTDKVIELNQSISDLYGEIASQNEKIVEQTQKVDYLEACLQEIYRSRGWLWLTRYRHLSAYLRNLFFTSTN